jgi:hypothetical protein
MLYSHYFRREYERHLTPEEQDVFDKREALRAAGD